MMGKRKVTPPETAPIEVAVRMSLFVGEGPEIVAKANRFPVAQTRRIAKQMKDLQLTGSGAKQLLSVQEAEVAWGVSERRIRAICSEGRLGFRLGERAFAIPREELIRYMQRERPSGHAGVTAKQEEMSEK